MENDWFKEYAKACYKARINIGVEPKCKFGILMTKKDSSKEYRDICTVELTDEEITEIKQEYGQTRETI